MHVNLLPEAQTEKIVLKYTDSRGKKKEMTTFSYIRWAPSSKNYGFYLLQR